MDNNEKSRCKLQKTYPNNLKTREVFKSIFSFNRQEVIYQWFDFKYERTNQNIKKHCKTAFLYTVTFRLISHLKNNVKCTVF